MYQMSVYLVSVCSGYLEGYLPRMVPTAVCPVARRISLSDHQDTQLLGDVQYLPRPTEQACVRCDCWVMVPKRLILYWLWYLYISMYIYLYLYCNLYLLRYLLVPMTLIRVVTFVRHMTPFICHCTCYIHNSSRLSVLFCYLVLEYRLVIIKRLSLRDIIVFTTSP